MLKIELFYRSHLGVCLVYIDENKPVYVVWKTKKDKAFRHDEFRHQTAQK